MKKLTWFETTREEIDNNPNTFNSENMIDEEIEDETTADEAITAIYEHSDIYLEETGNGEYRFTSEDGTEHIVCRIEII